MHKIDYHNHTYLCNHASGNLNQYIEKAIEKGLTEIGFCEHNPLPDFYGQPYRLKESEMDFYFNLVNSLKRDFPEFTIKIGMEVDYLPWCRDYLENQIKSYPFDYVIGSVHFIDDWYFDNPDNKSVFSKHSIDEIYKRYFDKYQEMIETGLFDIAGHADLIKKLGYRPQNLNLDNVFSTICKSLADNNMCFEINTSGLRKPVKEMYPQESFVKIAYQHGVPVVFGSDAHNSDEVCFERNQAVSMAKSAGYTKTVQFSQRQKNIIDIE